MNELIRAASVLVEQIKDDNVTPAAVYDLEAALDAAEDSDMAYVMTWVNQWKIRARNRTTGNRISFTRENHLTAYYTEVEARSWCERNGYDLVEVIDLGKRELSK